MTINGLDQKPIREIQNVHIWPASWVRLNRDLSLHDGTIFFPPPDKLGLKSLTGEVGKILSNCMDTTDLTGSVNKEADKFFFALPSNHNQIYKRFPITGPKGMVKVSLGCEVAWKRFNKCKTNYSVAWNEKCGESENAQQEICRNQLPKSEFSRELKYLLLDISNELP